MKQKLPQSTTALFPRNHRFITEYRFSQSDSHTIKILLISMFSIFLLGLIFLQGVTFWYNLQERAVFAQERLNMQQEITYWMQVSDKYKGYRDVYYRIASLEYKLGNTVEAQAYVKKALDLDPNFSEGRVLGAKVGL